MYMYEANMFISFFVSFQRITFKLGNFADFKTFFADRFSLTGPLKNWKHHGTISHKRGNGQGQNQGSKLLNFFIREPAGD